MTINHPGVTRRRLLQSAAVLLTRTTLGSTSDRDGVGLRNEQVVYGGNTLPVGTRSRYVDNVNGMRMHILEAGYEDGARPCVLLLHGFPELAYTWRNQLMPLAAAGFHVIAADLRGYGRSVTRPVAFDDDLAPYTLMNRVNDVTGLLRAVGHDTAAAVVGHDWSGPTAAWCGVLRPEIFQSVVLVSTPFAGNHKMRGDLRRDIEQDLAALHPPRQHYQWYCASDQANENMWHAPQGVHDFLRALYYFKSADWAGNRPFPLKSWSAAELARMPAYYVMKLHQGMAETVAAVMPSRDVVARCRWMTEQDLAVYAMEYSRTGFQGGLNLYRIFDSSGELSAFSGRTLDVPACYIAGASEWGVYQTPGAFEAMQHVACSRLLGVHLVKGAGHSVVEEQPDEVNRLILGFLRRVGRRG